MKESNKEEIKAAIKKNKSHLPFPALYSTALPRKKDKTYFQINVLDFRDRIQLRSKKEVGFAPDDLKNTVESNVQEGKHSR